MCFFAELTVGRHCSMQGFQHFNTWVVLFMPCLAYSVTSFNPESYLCKYNKKAASIFING